jgi:hypothetical protein
VTWRWDPVPVKVDEESEKIDIGSWRVMVIREAVEKGVKDAEEWWRREGAGWNTIAILEDNTRGGIYQALAMMCSSGYWRV